MCENKISNTNGTSHKVLAIRKPKEESPPCFIHIPSYSRHRVTKIFLRLIKLLFVWSFFLCMENCFCGLFDNLDYLSEECQWGLFVDELQMNWQLDFLRKELVVHTECKIE